MHPEKRRAVGLDFVYIYAHLNTYTYHIPAMVYAVLTRVYSLDSALGAKKITLWRARVTLAYA